MPWGTAKKAISFGVEYIIPPWRGLPTLRLTLQNVKKKGSIKQFLNYFYPGKWDQNIIIKIIIIFSENKNNLKVSTSRRHCPLVCFTTCLLDRDYYVKVEIHNWKGKNVCWKKIFKNYFHTLRGTHVKETSSLNVACRKSP